MTKKKVFITGIAGFVGIYLARELLEFGYDVHGSIYKDDPAEHITILKKQTSLHRLNILQPLKCLDIIKQVKPDYIFHLAAFSSVGRSFGAEQLTYDLNITGTLNMLQAAVNLKVKPTFFLASTSEVYGTIKPQTKTLLETDPVNPVSPYGVSKVAAEQIVKMYHQQYQLPVFIARSFNHSGPNQHPAFVIPSFCRKIVEIERGLHKPTMTVGNLAVKRDLSDVRDIVRGYRLMAEQGKSGETYQLCSGKAVSIKTVLNKLLALSDVTIKVETDKKLYRKNDIPVIRGDFAKARKTFGYEPRYNLDSTLTDTLNYWRTKL